MDMTGPEGGSWKGDRFAHHGGRCLNRLCCPFRSLLVRMRNRWQNVAIPCLVVSEAGDILYYIGPSSRNSSPRPPLPYRLTTTNRRCTTYPRRASSVYERIYETSGWILLLSIPPFPAVVASFSPPFFFTATEAPLCMFLA